MNKCFACRKDLEACWVSGDQYNDAVMFTARGNYGSSVYEPMESRLSLLIQICDGCLVDRKDLVLQVTEHRPLPTYNRIPWDPDGADTVGE